MSIPDDPRQFEDDDEPWHVVAAFNRGIRPTLTTDTRAATAGFKHRESAALMHGAERNH